MLIRQQTRVLGGNGASRQHMKDADKLRDTNFLFLEDTAHSGLFICLGVKHRFHPPGTADSTQRHF